MVSENGGLCGLRARVIAKVFFFLFFFLLLKVPSSIQLFIHQLVHPKTTWNTADRTLRTLPNLEYQHHFHHCNLTLFQKKAFPAVGSGKGRAQRSMSMPLPPLLCSRISLINSHVRTLTLHNTQTQTGTSSTLILSLHLHFN